jgi:hypothetical protein
MAPAFTIGLVRSELVARRIRADQLAHQREHERLRDAHDRKRIVDVTGGVDPSGGAGDAHAEEVARRPSERRIDLRVLSFGV